MPGRGYFFSLPESLAAYSSLCRGATLWSVPSTGAWKCPSSYLADAAILRRGCFAEDFWFSGSYNFSPPLLRRSLNLPCRSCDVDGQMRNHIHTITMPERAGSKYVCTCLHNMYNACKKKNGNGGTRGAWKEGTLEGLRKEREGGKWCNFVSIKMY